MRNPTARVFVAVDPPREVRQALAEWARRAVSAAGAKRRAKASPRVLDPALLHVTLCFLGSRPVEELDWLGSQLALCAGASGELSVGAPLWLPRRRPRALAVELHDKDGHLGALQARVSHALMELGEDDGHAGTSAGYARQSAGADQARQRRGRARQSAGHARQEEGHAEPSAGRARRRFLPHITVARMSSDDDWGRGALPPTPALSFVPLELVLYRSWLSPQGASYEALASQPLA